MITMTDLLRIQVLGPVLREREQEGERKLRLKQLTVRFGPVSEAIRLRIAPANEDQLSDWGVRLLSADRPGDLFGETVR